MRSMSKDVLLVIRIVNVIYKIFALHRLQPLGLLTALLKQNNQSLAVLLKYSLGT